MIPSAPAVARRPGPFAEAWARMRALLRPFRPRLYLGLAAVAFVARCGEGGCGSSFVQPPFEAGKGDGDPFERIRAWREAIAWFEWAKEHWVEILVATAVVVLVLAAVGLVIALVRAFFRFVFLRSCWEGRLAVASDLRRDAGRALGLFGWNVCLGLGGAAVSLVIVLAGVAVIVALGAASAEGASDGLGVAGGLVVFLVVIALVLALLGVFLVVALVRFVTHDLVVARAALEGTGIIAAWRAVLGRLRSAPGDLLSYIFFRLLGGAAVGVAEGILDIVLWLPFIAPFLVLDEPSVGVLLAILAAVIPYAIVAEAVTTAALLPLHAWLRLAAPCFLSPARPSGFCGGCGAPLPPEARFCGRCGRPV